MSNYSPEEKWQVLYKTALFEADKSKAAEKISDAERAIAARARSLFTHPDNASAERNALDAAFYALGVLKLYTRAPQNESNEGPIPVIQRSA
jgi:hypothetical protein